MGPLPTVADLNPSDVMNAITRDKKVVNGRLHFVLLTGIGTTQVVTDVTPSELASARRDRSASLGPESGATHEGARARHTTEPTRGTSSRRASSGWRQRPARRQRSFVRLVECGKLVLQFLPELILLNGIVLVDDLSLQHIDPPLDVLRRELLVPDDLARA